MIDVRSDTVTKPSKEMRAAMAIAEVGDDVYGEDPTVRALELKAAELTDQEDALFVTSGTQGNLVAMMTHCSRGDGVILGSGSHIYIYEGGGLAVLGGMMPLLVDDSGGIPSVEAIGGACKGENVHFAPARLLCLENTHNHHGGIAVSPECFSRAVAVARDRELLVHLDGARIFNAAVAHDVPASVFTGQVDSVQICLSKGLGAPVGSLVCGSKGFIHRARHWRKRLGGGLRQAGVIAAAGLYSLEHMVERLGEDHDHAALLAELLNRGGLAVEQHEGTTNMVFITLPEDACTAPELVARCGERGVLFNAVGERRVRLVAHVDVNEEMIRQTAEVILAAL